MTHHHTIKNILAVVDSPWLPYRRQRLATNFAVTTHHSKCMRRHAIRLTGHSEESTCSLSEYHNTAIICQILYTVASLHSPAVCHVKGTSQRHVSSCRPSGRCRTLGLKVRISSSAVSIARSVPPSALPQTLMCLIATHPDASTFSLLPIHHRWASGSVSRQLSKLQIIPPPALSTAITTLQESRIVCDFGLELGPPRLERLQGHRIPTTPTRQEVIAILDDALREHLLIHRILPAHN